MFCAVFYHAYQLITEVEGMSEVVGSAAGTLWDYLSEYGPVSVSKLTKETELDTKLVQRALGWLAREDKISFEMKGRTELVTLK